jgi:hypothetical protein
MNNNNYYNSDNWIGFDLDGTLAEYDDWKGPEHVGKPVPRMIKKAKDCINRGITVKILTARVAPRQCLTTEELISNLEDIVKATKAIKVWCKKHLGVELPVVSCKDFNMLWFYDDRCVQVERDTGYILGQDFKLPKNVIPY